MPLPKVLQNLIFDYYEQLQGVEMQESLRQHGNSLTLLEELMFAHRHYTTYDLEFHGVPPKVIRDLERIRGFNDPQQWDDRFLRVTTRYSHPKIHAILNKCLVLPRLK